ncbi:MAG: hypothetical protein F4201_06605 [Nitrospira sp. SB0677_bin_15]|nr:hypothetical protein [Nitrospira sp. SB0677_bin_15]
MRKIERNEIGRGGHGHGKAEFRIEKKPYHRPEMRDNTSNFKTAKRQRRNKDPGFPIKDVGNDEGPALALLSFILLPWIPD